MALLIVLTMSHPHVGFYSKINICFYAKFYGQSFATRPVLTAIFRPMLIFKATQQESCSVSMLCMSASLSVSMEVQDHCIM